MTKHRSDEHEIGEAGSHHGEFCRKSADIIMSKWEKIKKTRDDKERARAAQEKESKENEKLYEEAMQSIKSQISAELEKAGFDGTEEEKNDLIGAEIKERRIIPNIKAKTVEMRGQYPNTLRVGSHLPVYQLKKE